MKKVLKVAVPVTGDSQATKRAVQAIAGTELTPHQAQTIIDAVKKQTRLVTATTPVELKLVQDTRIYPEVVHLMIEGCESPVMQFYVGDHNKIVFHRYTSQNDGPVEYHNSEIVEDRQFGFIPNVPKHADAFGPRTTADTIPVGCEE